MNVCLHNRQLAIQSVDLKSESVINRGQVQNNYVKLKRGEIRLIVIMWSTITFMLFGRGKGERGVELLDGHKIPM